MQHVHQLAQALFQDTACLDPVVLLMCSWGKRRRGGGRREEGGGGRREEGGGGREEEGGGGRRKEGGGGRREEGGGRREEGGGRREKEGMSTAARVGCGLSLTAVLAVEAVGHGEAEGSEEDPAVLLVVDHEVEGRPHSGQEASLVVEGLGVLSV